MEKGCRKRGTAAAKGARKRAGLLLLALGLVAACAARPSLPLPPQPVTVEPESGVSPVTRSHTEVIVRTYFVEDDTRREVGGADCVLATGDYAARFTSPGRVIVPLPAGYAPPLTVTCHVAGREGTARQPALRRWADYPSYDPWDPWGHYPFGHRRTGAWLTLSYPAVYGGPWRRSGPHAVYYPDIGVGMR